MNCFFCIFNYKHQSICCFSIEWIIVFFNGYKWVIIKIYNCSSKGINEIKEIILKVSHDKVYSIIL